MFCLHTFEEATVEVRIGITHSARELSFDTEASAEEVRKAIETSVSDGSSMVSLSDTKGNQFLVNTASIAYVELGSDTSRRVGFVS